MKAALVQPDNSLKVSEVPSPEPGPGSLVVKVAYCGICGSDVHMLDAGMMPTGSVPGHELSGSIAAIGQGVEDWREGDPVVVLPLDPCFACEPCRGWNVSLCQDGVARAYGLGGLPGGFSEYMQVRPSMLFRVPDGMDLKTAALNEPWAVAVHGVNLSGFKVGGSAVVMGAGPIGLLCVSALQAAGAAGIYVSEPDPFRADKARALGVDAVFNPKTDYTGAAVQEKLGRAPEYVFDCAGTDSSMEEAAGIAGVHGHVVALGVPMRNTTLFPLPCFLKETRFSFSFGYTYREFGECLRLLGSGRVRPDVVVSGVMPLGEIGSAMKRLHGSGHAKILIDCQAV
ncbi:MAG: alcohol dehydrogenase catalytic domain-containing protein [bacterium]